MKIIIKLIAIIILTSCNRSNEEYKQLSSVEINQLLKENNKKLTALEVMRLYYNYPITSNEGNEKIELIEDIMDNGNTVITLIHDNFSGDSVKGEKYKMELKKIDNKWVVISIKKNWKCWDGRGHINWGIEFCT